MDFMKNQAIYLQVADYLCEQILLRKWKEGEKIPSIRDMAVTMGVNPNTVNKTYTFLQEKGIITNQRGLGYFVADRGYEHTLELKKEDFIGQELPHFFKTMDLLRMTFEDIKNYYDKRGT